MRGRDGVWRSGRERLFLWFIHLGLLLHLCRCTHVEEGVCAETESETILEDLLGVQDDDTSSRKPAGN